jgi:hypothetical protein
MLMMKALLPLEKFSGPGHLATPTLLPRRKTSAGRLPGRCGQRPSEYPTVASRHLLLESRPAAPATESSSLTTADFGACRGCLKGWLLIAWGPDADRHDMSLIHMSLEGGMLRRRFTLISRHENR